MKLDIMNNCMNSILKINSLKNILKNKKIIFIFLSENFLLNNNNNIDLNIIIDGDFALEENFLSFQYNQNNINTNFININNIFRNVYNIYRYSYINKNLIIYQNHKYDSLINFFTLEKNKKLYQKIGFYSIIPTINATLINKMYNHIINFDIAIDLYTSEVIKMYESLKFINQFDQQIYNKLLNKINFQKYEYQKFIISIKNAIEYIILNPYDSIYEMKEFNKQIINIYKTYDN